jgi:hypothetical protein
LRLLRLIGLALGARALRRRCRTQAPPSPLRFAPQRQRFGALTVADIAFDYERAILELDDVKEETKTHAAWALSRIILPLVGDVRLDDVTRDFESGVRAVLVGQLEDKDWVGHVWDDLLTWGRIHFTPPQRSLWNSHLDYD